jgi:prepilin-type N-terminal cleavage/methylation domain-containing protein
MKIFLDNKIRSKKASGFHKGFTLVEVLLYLSIISVILFSVSFLLSILVEARIKNQTITEIDQIGAQVMSIMEQTIRNSDEVISPGAKTSSFSCSLSMSDATKNPTVFEEVSGVIRMREGVGEFVNLTSGYVEASNLSFSNLARDNTKGILRIQFTLTYKNYSGRNEYSYSKNFYGSAGLR